MGSTAPETIPWRVHEMAKLMWQFEARDRNCLTPWPLLLLGPAIFFLVSSDAHLTLGGCFSLFASRKLFRFFLYAGILSGCCSELDGLSEGLGECCSQWRNERDSRLSHGTSSRNRKASDCESSKVRWEMEGQLTNLISFMIWEVIVMGVCDFWGHFSLHVLS